MMQQACGYIGLPRDISHRGTVEAVNGDHRTGRLQQKRSPFLRARRSRTGTDCVAMRGQARGSADSANSYWTCVQ